MSALAEALVAAQRRSLATLEKAYVAGAIEAEAMGEAMEACGITDAVDRAFLVASRCHFDLTGEDSSRREPEAPPRVEGPTE